MNTTTTSSHPEITSADIPAVLNRSMLSGNRKPPIFLALYGIGKSHQVAKFAKDKDLHYIDYRAPFKTFNEVRGFGIPNRENMKMEFCMDEDLDFSDDKQNLFHAEEVLNAAPAVQKVLMQLFLDRRIGKFHVPEGTVMAASSNRLRDRTGVERMMAALADRFSIYHVRPDFDAFMNFLETESANPCPELIAFLNTNSDAPYNFDIKQWDGESNFPTFRSFERLGEVFNSYGGIKEANSDLLFKSHAAACIGPKYGAMFTQFIKLAASIGDVDKMLREADTCTIPPQPDIRWIIACRLNAMADRENLERVLVLSHRLSDSTGGSWKLGSTPTAMQSFVVKSIERVKPHLLRTPELLEWNTKFASVLTSL